MSSYTVWAKLVSGEYGRIRTFEDEELAEKFLAYLDRFCELDSTVEIEDLFIKEDGLPVYQLYYLNPDDEEVEIDDSQDLYFDFDEVLEELDELSKNNPFTKFQYREINIDDTNHNIIEIPSL